MAKLSELLKGRGYVYQHSSETLEEITDGPKRTLYLGVDPSADSLHIGHLQAMLVLRRFLEDGHNVILVVGGGTGLIGDPSGKSEERPLLGAEVVAKNAEAIGAQAHILFAGKEFRLVNNADWLAKLTLLDFLRDVGKHFSVNAMLDRDSVRERLENVEKGISYTEFSYMLLQAYDFLHLYREYGCDLQIGASDQWGNIASGIDLIRRTAGAQVYGFTSPLLVNKATGKKFGKSESGTVWLDPAKTTPFMFYQFWFNMGDEDLKELLMKMTLLSGAEIDAGLELHARDSKERHGQKLLAREVTALVHGREEAEKAEVVSQTLFGDAPLSALSDEARKALRAAAPSCEAREGHTIVDVLVSSGLASSKREAREFITSGAVELNGVAAGDSERTLTATDFYDDLALLKRGKRHVCVLVRT